MRDQPFELSLLDKLVCIFRKPVSELWLDYNVTRGFTKLHEVLLRIDVETTLTSYLDLVVAEGNASVILDAKDCLGRSALDLAVEHGWVSAAATLLDYGADINQRRRGGLTMLHLALAGPSCGQASFAFSKMIELLLRRGADVNARDWEGWTPLHIAASWRSADSVQRIAEHAGQYLDWEARTSQGQTAVQLYGGPLYLN